MQTPVRSFSYGPDSTSQNTMSAKKRKRGPDADTSLSCHLSWLSGSHTFSSQPTAPTPALSDASSTLSEPPPAEDFLPLASPQPHSSSQPFIFHSPRKSKTSLLQRPIAQPHPNKRPHFTSSPVIPPTPALTYSSDNLSQLNLTTTACHLCRRRPGSVQELPSFTDCETCRLRTCNVCTRVCEAPRCKAVISARQTFFSGATPLTADLEAPRGKTVCRACCVEVGVEGRVWCEACYADDTEVENFSLGKGKKELQGESMGRIASWLEDCGTTPEIPAQPEDMTMEDTDWN